MYTVGELREMLADLDDETPIRVGLQPNYPLRGVVDRAVVIEDGEDGSEVLWLATSQVSSYDESPYEVPSNLW